MAEPDAIVVGAGPNGLTGALVLARAGLKVLVLEMASRAGGGTRTAELTLAGFKHDVCSAIHPTALASPAFQELGLEVDWIHPEFPLAHPLDGGRAVVLERSVEHTAARLGRDGKAYRRLIGWLAQNWTRLDREILNPLSWPRHPLALARFGLAALQPASGLLRWAFRQPEARALLAGICAHTIVPLEFPPSMAPGLVLGVIGHVYGWPIPRGGSQAVADSLVAALQAAGGEVRTGHRVTALPRARVVLLDLTPRQLLALEGAERLSSLYRRRLRGFRYGPGVFKIDYALSGPVPWSAPEARRAGTVHLGGTLEEIAASERDAWNGRHSLRPYVLVAQSSLFDPTRAPAGQHTLWAYCHAPHGSDVDMTDAIEGQLERFAPGFRDLVLARSTMSAAQMEVYNPNYIGGDIGGGALTLTQLFSRPILSLCPWATSLPGVYLCSSSTPPGGGVHGMCGYLAAKAALRRL